MLNFHLTKLEIYGIIITEKEKEYITMREKLLDRIIRIYGFEHHVTIKIAQMLESPKYSDREMEMLVECHEKFPIGRERCR